MDLLLGQAAEHAARDFLEAQGLQFVAANYRCREGEVDLIMQQAMLNPLPASLLIFVEVRLRNQQYFGGAAASVTLRKQQKIIASAGAFLQHHPEFSRSNCRFDVVAMQKKSAAWDIEWLPAAFTT